jgi:integrase
MPYAMLRKYRKREDVPETVVNAIYERPRTLVAVPDDVVTVKEAADQFFAQKQRVEAWSPMSIVWYEREIGRFVSLGPSAAICDVSAEWLYHYCNGMAKRGLAPAGQQKRYAAVLTFLTWCTKAPRRWLARNPSVEVDTDELPWRGRRGRRTVGRGKTLLRDLAEVEAFVAESKRLRNPQHRAAALLLVHLRVDTAKSVLHVRSCDDVDAQGQDGWDVKSAASERRVPMHDDVQEPMERLCKGRLATDLVFPTTNGTVHGYMWLEALVWSVCDRAKTAGGNPIRQTTPHGLRGVYATVELERGTTPAVVANRLGHTSERVGRAHYFGVAPLEHRGRQASGR